MRLFFLLVFHLVLVVFSSIGQQQNNVWLFGNNAGLDFSTNPPSPISSPLVALEGTASVSDINGNLLFYTNGITIWDNSNTPMPNGSGILGGASSTQPALIIPLPNSCQKYYVFTTEDHMGAGTMRYSLVDMCLNNGLGDVVASEKNVLLANNVVEKLTSALHSNGTDIWVISHHLSSNQFVSFHVTPFGVNPTPVVSAVGSTYVYNNYIGPIRASQDGTKIAASTSFWMYSCELFDFNKNTGALTFNTDLTNNGIASNVYGLEFSPNGNFLYISTCWGTNHLYQYNLLTNTSIELTNQSGNYLYGGMQLGNDGRIYMARNNQPFLGVINNPNTLGIACNYVDNGISLASGTTSAMGLPNYNPYSFSFQQASSNLIADSSIQLCSSFPIHIDADCNATILWSDGVTSSDIIISQPGTYSVTVTNNCNILTDSIIVLASSLSDTISLPGDTTFCTFPSSGFTINPIVNGALSSPVIYSWSTGETSSSIHVASPGTYWVDINLGCNQISDTIVITDEQEIITMPSVLNVCGTDFPITISPTITNYDSFVWDDGTSILNHQFNNPGTYTLNASNGCGTISSSITINTVPYPAIDLLPTIDTCLNVGGQITLLPSYTNVNTFEWSTGSNQNQISVQNSGNYWVAGFNQCGSDTSWCSVTINHLPLIEADTLLNICANDFPVILDPMVINDTSLFWSDGVLTESRSITTPGVYTITASNGCGSVSSNFTVNQIALPVVSVSPTVDTCLNAGDQIVLLPTYANVNTIEWSTGSNQNQIFVPNSGIYWVAGFNQCGSDTSFCTVAINLFPELYLPTVLDTCFEIGVGFSYTATGTPGNYSWSSGSQTASEWISTEGLYTCTLTNSCGSISETMQVNHTADVDLNIMYDTLRLCSDEILLSELQIETNYEMDIYNEYGQFITSGIDQSGWYIVNAYNPCKSVIDSFYVDLQSELYFYVPNSFTPNTDNRNELFKHEGTNVFIREVYIFDRWGEIIYKEEGDFSGWDGTYLNKACPDGVYAVEITYLNCFGLPDHFSGHVNLLR